MSCSVLVRCVLVLLCLQQQQLAAGQSVTWRYGSNILTRGDQLPSYKNPVLLECVGWHNVTWSSTSCQVIEKNDASSAELSCSRPGIHQITVQGVSQNTTTASTVNVPLKSTPHCYIWGIEIDFMTSNTSRQATVSIWVEQGNTTDSQREALTHQFYSLGESPRLQSLTPSAELKVTSHGFDSMSSVWEFVVEEVEGLPAEVAVEVTGSGVIAVDCGISPLQFVMVTRELNNSMLTASTEYFQPSSAPTLVHDKTALGIAILLHGRNSYISQDDLATLQKFQVVGVSGVISDVAFTSAGLCVLVDEEIHILPYDSSEVTSTTDLELSGVHYLTGRSMHSAGETYNIIVVWTNDAESVLISEDGGMSFTSLALSSTLGAVQSVIIHPFKRTITVLTTSSSSVAQFAMYELGNQSWSEETFSFAYSGSNLTAVYGADEFGDIFIWDSTTVYYSPNGGVTVDTVELYTRSDSAGSTGAQEVFEWLDGEYIKQIVSGKGGQFSVLSSGNRLFYGTVTAGWAVEITSGELPDTEAVLSFNSLGQLRMLSFESNSTGFTVRSIPTYSLLMDALYPPPACPFSMWTHSHKQSMHYLDKRENLTLWASVIPAQWKGNDISYVVSDPDSMESTSESVEEQTAVVGVIQRNLTVNIKPLSSLNSSARTAVKFSAATQNLACPSSAQLVSLIAIECPPGRHIRVKDVPSKCSSSYKDYTYTIPKDRYDDTFGSRRSNSDKRVEYDLELYGCPIEIPYTQRFRPRLQLYSGDALLEEVDADFVVWEIHGRHDYTYTANAEKAKCSQTPQTWAEMLENAEHPSEAWTTETYRPCYEEGGELNKRVKYHILNSTGVSSLKWPEHNGMYIFAATVVARDYSFCHLTVHFAVKVYGASGAVVLGYILLVLTCFIGIGVLIFSYYMYKHGTK